MAGQSLKGAIRRGLAWMHHASGLPLMRHRGAVLILMYHRVVPEDMLKEQYVQPGMYVVREVFEEQMIFLKKSFQILSFADLLSGWKWKALHPDETYCVVTFDDGWSDNYECAYPLLKKHDIPATIFLATGMIGTQETFWSETLGCVLQEFRQRKLAGAGNAPALDMGRQWDSIRTMLGDDYGGVGEDGWRERIDQAIESCKAMPDADVEQLVASLCQLLGVKRAGDRAFLSWEEVEEMSANGISFGSHSCSHRMLTRMPRDEVRRELLDSREALMARRVNEVPIFCYPNGSYDNEVQALARECGYQGAVTTQFGAEGARPSDLFGLRRIGIHNDVSSSIPLFSFRLSGLDRGALLPHRS